MTKKEIFITFSITLALVFLFIFSPKLTYLLPNISHFADNFFVTSVIIIVAALLDSVNPCAFSILFLTIVFLFSLGKDRRFVLKTGALYIFGIFAVYFLIGVGLLKVLSFFDITNGIAKIGAGILIVFAALDILGNLIPNFPIKLKIPQFAHKKIGPMIEKATPITATALGFVVGLFEFPCTGGPYLFILSLLHEGATFMKGLGFLVVYNIIFIAPLVIALILASNQKVALKLDEIRRNNTKKSSIYLSIFMILLGLFVFLA